MPSRCSFGNPCSSIYNKPSRQHLRTQKKRTLKKFRHIFFEMGHTSHCRLPATKESKGSTCSCHTRIVSESSPLFCGGRGARGGGRSSKIVAVLTETGAFTSSTDPVLSSLLPESFPLASSVGGVCSSRSGLVSVSVSLSWLSSHHLFRQN